MNSLNEALSAAEVFSIWSPSQGPWSNWVKPALFASVDENMSYIDNAQIQLPEVPWHSSELQRSALILDLPGDQSIWEGLALLKYHYQPVPLFNCSRAPGMIIDVNPLVQALWNGSNLLKLQTISQHAMPVFLLDNNRLSNIELRAPGKFDNRWCVVPQDMPSSIMLKSFGVKAVCIRTTKMASDIPHILKRYQVDGIKVSVQYVGNQKMEDFSMPMSTLFRSIWYRIEVLSGLKRNSAGGFGAMIPVPSPSGSHGGFG